MSMKTKGVNFGCVRAAFTKALGDRSSGHAFNRTAVDRRCPNHSIFYHAWRGTGINRMLTVTSSCLCGK